MRPQPGVGTRLTAYDALGFTLSAAPGGASYGHPWKPFLGGHRLQLAHGLVDAFTPKIGREPMNGRDGRTMTPLLLAPDKANANGESWAVLECEPDDKGLLTDKSRIEIVHSQDAGRSLDPKIARLPLVLLLWQSRRAFRALPIIHFHLRYIRVEPSPGGGAVGHLFL